MMYSEFVAGTGCRDNEFNYKVFQNLEVMYMNSNMSKAEIYEYGKKLVDNSKTEEELRLEAELTERINDLKNEIASTRSFIKWKEELMEIAKADGDTEMVRFYRNTIRNCKARIHSLRQDVAGCQWVLAH